MKLHPYTQEDFQTAYKNWATLSESLFGTNEAWVKERQERWYNYCDVRDRLPPGTTKERRIRFEGNHWPRLV